MVHFQPQPNGKTAGTALAFCVPDLPHEATPLLAGKGESRHRRNRVLARGGVLYVNAGNLYAFDLK